MARRGAGGKGVWESFGGGAGREGGGGEGWVVMNARAVVRWRGFTLNYGKDDVSLTL